MAALRFGIEALSALVRMRPSDYDVPDLD
jgi:hypothetical protein